MGGPVNPADAEDNVIAISNQIAERVSTVSAAESEARRLERIRDRKFAQEYLKASGPQTEKRYRAELATAQERTDAEVAELAFRHAQRQMKALESRLSAHQTVVKSTTAMYGASGSGRGH